MAEAVRIDDGQRRYLLKNYESIVFVDETGRVDKYKCSHCGKVAIKHHVTNCKHLFCSGCIKELFDKPCPICKVEITEVMKDAMIEKGMLELNVECQYKKRGCHQIIALYKYQEHEAKCQFSSNGLSSKLHRDHSQTEKLEECEDELQQVKVVMREIREDIKNDANGRDRLANSLRSISDRVDAINQDIKEIKIASQDMKALKENYEKLKTIGQDYEALKTMHHENRKLKDRHLDLKNVIHKLQHDMQIRTEFENNTRVMVADMIANMSKNSKPLTENTLHDDVQLVKRQGKQHLDPDEMVCHGTVFLWKIAGFKKSWQNLRNPLQHQDSQERQQISTFLKPSQQIIRSEQFHDIKFDFVFAVNLKFDKPNITIDLSWHRCNSIFSHARKFTLLDQSERAVKRNISFTDTPLFSKNSTDHMQQSYFCDCTLVSANLLEQQLDAYIKDDALLVEIRLMPLALMYKSVASRNGILLWHIDNYAKKKQEEMNGTRQCLISDSFYTAQEGYRVHVRLHLNGDGQSKGKHISIYVDFIMGEFDKVLPSRFNGLVKFFLRDQSGSANMQHVCQESVFPHSEGGRYHGKRDFVLQSQAEMATYLKKDSLLFKIMVEII